MFNLGEFITAHIIWIVPIVSIILTFFVIVISTPDNEHLNLKDFLSIGINLCISAITILLTNYKSVTTTWLIFFFFVITLFVAILTRKFMWGRSKLMNIFSCILYLITGIIFCVIAGGHLNGVIQTICM